MDNWYGYFSHASHVLMAYLDQRLVQLAAIFMAGAFLVWAFYGHTNISNKN